ncbi:unnamed protein product [Merluccius merluccius]
MSWPPEVAAAQRKALERHPAAQEGWRPLEGVQTHEGGSRPLEVIQTPGNKTYFWALRRQPIKCHLISVADCKVL